MNRNLLLLCICQGLFLTNNVTFIAINGLVGLQLAPQPWMATLPVMGYVVGGALAAPLVSRCHDRLGARGSFLLGLLVALGSALAGAFAVSRGSFALLVATTVVAGFYSANGQLYRFAAADLATPAWRDRAVSLVLAGGLLGAVIGPNLAAQTRGWTATPFAGAYLALAIVAVVGLALMACIRFPERERGTGAAAAGRPMREIARQPLFIVATLGSALGYGVMNLLMAATPLAMQTHHHDFESTALVLEWHVIGMFAPGFVTGSLITRFGPLKVMAWGLALNVACVAIALGGVDLHRFVAALFLLGVGWNFLFTASTALALRSWQPEERNRAQAFINVCVFTVMAFTSFGAGALFTTRGWTWLNLGSLVPIAAMAVALVLVRGRVPRR